MFTKDNIYVILFQLPRYNNMCICRSCKACRLSIVIACHAKRHLIDKIVTINAQVIYGDQVSGHWTRSVIVRGRLYTRLTVVFFVHRNYYNR